MRWEGDRKLEKLHTAECLLPIWKNLTTRGM